jgi:aminoglycoside phosphotransferase (APT) family kinase protein
MVEAQLPRWGGLPVEGLRTAGTVHAIYRAGAGLTARFRLLDQDAGEARASILREARAARELATVSTVPTPEPVAIGEPGAGYPLLWSIQTWLPRNDATVDDPGARSASRRTWRTCSSRRGKPTREDDGSRARSRRAPARP